MEAFLVKKSGTKETIKAFYKSGIITNAVVFCVADVALYSLIATQTNTRLVDFQLINCAIPIAAAIIFSAIMIVVSSGYVENHYQVKVIKKKDSSEEVQVEVI